MLNTHWSSRGVTAVSSLPKAQFWEGRSHTLTLKQTLELHHILSIYIALVNDKPWGSKEGWGRRVQILGEDTAMGMLCCRLQPGQWFTGIRLAQKFTSLSDCPKVKGKYSYDTYIMRHRNCCPFIWQLVSVYQPCSSLNISMSNLFTQTVNIVFFLWVAGQYQFLGNKCDFIQPKRIIWGHLSLFKKYLFIWKNYLVPMSNV